MRDLQLTLVRSESTQRNYMLSGNPQYLKQYREVNTTIDLKIEALRTLTSDNHSQTRLIEEVRDLIKQKLEFLDSTDGLVSPRGRALVDLIAAVFQSVEEAELALLATRVEREASDSRMTEGSEALGLVLAFALLLLLVSLLNKEIATRMIVKAELIKAQAPAQEASEMKPSFLANMNHEMPTPLNVDQKDLGCSVEVASGGHEVLHLVREGAVDDVHRGIPIIAKTTSAIKGDIPKYLQVGMNDCIEEPVSFDDLACKSGKWLKRESKSIDLDEFRKMIDLSVVNNPTFLKKLLSIFEVDTRESIFLMKAQMQAGYTADVGRLAHKLKSSSASLGAKNLRDVFESIERSTKTDCNPDHFLMLIDTADQEFERALTDLKTTFPNCD